MICHSGMDLSPFDIFNEILINQKDIKYFLKQFNINYNQPLPSMIIQGTVLLLDRLDQSTYQFKTVESLSFILSSN